ncbi:MAG TPA: Uma2 family endonuclease [Planctomycetaceae bacterium]|nr:Uma2 family endonuclease [Planctomycetaceae bacterium]
MTAEEFADQIYDLPEGGRWTELIAGAMVTLDPPDDAHGNCVRNLATILAEYAQRSERGYACFDLGIIVERSPDTVQFPSACYFLDGPRFSEQDKQVTESRPALVIEIASTNDRRKTMQARVDRYLEKLVPRVWVIDPHGRQVHIFQPGANPRTFKEHETLRGEGTLPDSQLPVSSLFVEPDWWAAPRKK